MTAQPLKAVCMISSDTAIEAERFHSVGDTALTAERLRDQSIWARDAEIRAADAAYPGRLWLGLVAALPFALAFWWLVWLGVGWALRV